MQYSRQGSPSIPSFYKDVHTWAVPGRLAKEAIAGPEATAWTGPFLLVFVCAFARYGSGDAAGSACVDVLLFGCADREGASVAKASYCDFRPTAPRINELSKYGEIAVCKCWSLVLGCPK